MSLDTFDKRMLGDRRVLDEKVNEIVRLIASNAAKAAARAAINGEL